MRCRRATLRGTAVPSTSRDAIMISATWKNHETHFDSCTEGTNLVSSLCMLEAESHATGDLPSFTRQRPKHRFKSSTC